MANIKSRVSVVAGLAMVAAFALVSCSGKTTSTASTGSGATGAPSSGRAPTTTSTAPADAIVYGPTAFASGQDSCNMGGDAHATWSTDPDGTTRARDGWFTCTVSSNDPRVAGTLRATWNANQWGTGADNGSMVQWGTMRLTNEGGSWVGRYRGIYTSETGDVVANVLIGTGDYAGLSYYTWEYKGFGSTWPSEGLIFPSATAPR